MRPAGAAPAMRAQLRRHPAGATLVAARGNRNFVTSEQEIYSKNQGAKSKEQSA